MSSIRDIAVFMKANLVSATADYELKECDLCLVVGTSSVVYPAAMFAPQVNGIVVVLTIAGFLCIGMIYSYRMVRIFLVFVGVILVFRYGRAL